MSHRRHASHVKERNCARSVVFGLLAMTIGCRSPRTAEDAQRWAEAWIESLNSHRIQQVTPLLDPAATYQDPMTGKPLSGMALAIFFVTLWNRAPESHYEVRSVTGIDEFVAVEWSATNLGDATAKAPLEGVFLIHFSGTHITMVRAYYDRPPLPSGLR